MFFNTLPTFVRLLARFFYTIIIIYCIILRTVDLYQYTANPATSRIIVLWYYYYIIVLFVLMYYHTLPGMAAELPPFEQTSC